MQAIRTAAFRLISHAARSTTGSSVALAARRFSVQAVGPKNIADTLQIGRLNHVAIAVPNIAESSKLYRDVMGAKVSEPVPQPDHGVYTVFVELDNTKIELIHPLGENSPISKFLQQKPGGGIHHVCFEVEDINKAVEVLKAKGIKVIDPKPKIGAHGKPVVFLHPKDLNGVLVELEQK